MMICRQFLLSRRFDTRPIRQLNTSYVKRNNTDARGSVNQSSANADIHNGNYEQKIDEPQHEYIHTSKFQRLILSVGSSVAALVNPRR